MSSTARAQAALVVGAAYGVDAEYLASRGFDVTAFDVAPSAVRGAQERYPDSPVHYVVADLLDPPRAWAEAFPFVYESLTVQSLPDAVRPQAIAQRRPRSSHRAARCWSSPPAVTRPTVRSTGRRGR